MIIRKKMIIYLSLILIIVISFVNFSLHAAENDVKIITDMAGRKVEISAKVERIVTSYKSATQFVFALGAEKKLVGIDMGSPSQKLFQKLYPDIKDLPIVGSKRKGLNLEEIISLNPDLVILYPYNEGPELAKKLKIQGIPSIIIKPESYELIKKTNIILGKALGLERKAKIVDNQYEKILEIIKGVTDIPAACKKKVYFANSNLLDSVGKGMLQTSMIELAGGINPVSKSKSGFVKISSEQLINWDPDLIIVSNYFKDDIEKLKDMEKYKYINAFKTGKIYRFPSNLEPWDFPSPSSLMGILCLSRHLYPERYSDIDYEDILNNFYKTLYGISYDQLGGKL